MSKVDAQRALRDARFARFAAARAAEATAATGQKKKTPAAKKPASAASAPTSPAELGDAELADAELADAELADAELADATLGDGEVLTAPAPTLTPAAEVPASIGAVIPASDSDPETDSSTEELCGHKSMNGRSCTRAKGHPQKSHRYS
jgi:hypothetical protein